MTETEFEKTFREYFTFMRNIAFSVVRDDATAKDIVQEVFLNFWNKRNALQVRGNMKPYLQRATVNTSINFIKKNKKLYFADEMEVFESVDDCVYDEERTKAIELGVAKAMKQLSPRCQLVFSLSRFSKMANKEIAEYLNISVKGVEKNIGKALKELRVTLKPLYNSTLLIILLIKVGFFNVFMS